MRKIVFALAMMAAWPALAQSPRSTQNNSVTITLGNTYQTILTAQQRQSLTIQNNNLTTDNCWIQFGVGVTAANATKGASIVLTPGGSFQRYFPYVPQDAIQATCATTGNTLYVDTQ